MKPRFVIVFALALSLVATVRAQVSLIPTNTLWLYVANGSDLGTEWRATFFNDADWNFGVAQFGWGDGDENTVLFSGNNVSNAPVTTYFRNTFFFDNPPGIQTLTLRVVCDDGAVVYLNGTEVARHNLPAGVVNFQTPAVTDIVTNESARIGFSVSPGVLLYGLNTVAVELHQSTNGRADGSFDLELIGNLPNSPPQISLTSPADGATFPSNTVSFAAAASDADGAVTRVDYFAGTNLVGSATVPPFAFSTLLATGRHSLYGIAYDNFAASTKSPTVRVQVGGEQPVNPVRGPYLQSGTPSGMIVRWRTDWFTNSAVRYGTNPGVFNLLAASSNRTTEHAVQLTGLRADTKYYFEVGSASEWFAGGHGSFRTSPTNTRPVKVWVIGDSGRPNENARGVRDAFVNAVGPINTDLWLMLGDNAYDNGTDAEYQAAVFDTYPDILRRLVVWSTPGNHDVGAAGVPGQFPYFDIFSFPTGGESGGVPSGSERYYSFDYANIHFVSLDSQSSIRTSGSPMLTWLREDLAATDKDWIVAFWHQPPYSFGTHDSDGETALIEMREHAVPILEAYGVDLVLAGHSHVYERSFLLNGHYGYSYTLTTNMILDHGLGNVAPYRKPAGGLGAHQGALYAVCGCSGEGEPGWEFERHPAMATNLSGFGSMILNFNGQRLDGVFLRPDGTTNDVFALDKSQPATVRPQLQVQRAPGGVALSWPTSLPVYSPEASLRVGTNAVWQSVTNVSVRAARRNVVNVGLGGSNQFFRLRSNP